MVIIIRPFNAQLINNNDTIENKVKKFIILNNRILTVW